MNILALPILFAGFTSQASIIVAVGAQNAFIIRQGIARSHVPQIIAICIFADILLISLGTQGMSQVVTGHPTLLTILTWLGAAVLTLYGVMALHRAYARIRLLRQSSTQSASNTRSVGRDRDTATGPGTPTNNATLEGSSLKKTLLTCLGFTFLNPGVYLDTIVLLGGIAATYGAQLKWSFATGAMACSIVWFVLLGFLSSRMSRLFNSTKDWIALDGIIGITMMVLALHLVMR